MHTLFVLLVAAAGGAAQVESLPQRTGPAEIRTPEGFIRLEGRGSAAPGRGSFGVYPATAYGRSSAPPAAVVAPSGEAAPRAPDEAPAKQADPCRRERNQYVRRLLRMDGIDVDEPLAILDGLSGPAGYSGALLFSSYGLLPGVDALRPLAWDFELQSLARELARCAATARASSR